MRYEKVVVLTGAGISAESGLKTFRDNHGLWENHKVEEVATPEAFERNPELVYRFYNQRRQQLLRDGLKANAAHLALAELERKIGKNLTIITQNVDNLHEVAGSKNVLHMHGELLKARCCNSGRVFETQDDFELESSCSCCQPAARIRPHIVWFGEMPLYMQEIQRKLMEADLFIAIGTSGQVYPAAGFVAEAVQYGAHTVELNLEPSSVNRDFEQHIYGPATEIVPEFVRHLSRGV